MGSCCTKDNLPGPSTAESKVDSFRFTSARQVLQKEDGNISFGLDSKARADYCSTVEEEPPRMQLTHKRTSYGSAMSLRYSGVTEKKTQTDTSTTTDGTNRMKADVMAGQLIKCDKMNSVHLKVAGVMDSRSEKLARLEEIPGFSELKLPRADKTGPYKVASSGSTYEGQVSDAIPHGLGRLITSKGALIEGYFHCGKLTKFVRFIDVDSTVYTGGIENKLKHGWGIYRDVNGVTIHANWCRGVTQGMVKILDAKGEVIFEGFTDKGMRTGYGKVVNKIERFTYTGSFRNDKFNGFGRKVYENGQVYEGMFKYGLEHGAGELRYIDGRVLRINFEYGHPRGTGILITTARTFKEVTY
jgi:hypothetical protein